MGQTALRPRPMPGDRRGPEAGDGPGSGRPGQDGGRGRGRRLVSAVSGVLIGAFLVLSGAGLGAMGATVIGAASLAEPKRPTGTPPAASPRSAPAASSEPAAPVVARLGVEVADDGRPGARVVGVHIPGPGFSAGLTRGDVLLAFGSTRVDSAADLARAVARARPGEEVTLTVRRRSGGYQQLTAVPGIVT
ncbi:PDZ domain-containing protein [Streptomyces griseoloalbus]|uniref:PDZ domain-containing protein n=1 Tax=Streptomyces griseoloalbus TaxID=67303 RepID=UPI001873E385|nr:PDZ domain-containing protein [Streptomyces griseoloalbus]